MAEFQNDDGSQRAKIRLAKNEGLSSEDDQYLKMLFDVLVQIARSGTTTRTMTETPIPNRSANTHLVYYRNVLRKG